MRKFLYILTGLALGSSLTAFAVSYRPDFIDKSGFAEWFGSSVNRMSILGVIKGYPDGAFKPYNNVTRAETAVMFDRFYDSLDNKLQRVLKEYDRLANSGYDYKIFLVMAESGLKALSTPPDLTRFNIEKDVKLPESYTLYSDKAKAIVFTYYLHYVGYRPSGDVMLKVDEWYGPFGANQSI